MLEEAYRREKATLTAEQIAADPAARLTSWLLDRFHEGESCDGTFRLTAQYFTDIGFAPEWADAPTFEQFTESTPTINGVPTGMCDCTMVINVLCGAASGGTIYPCDTMAPALDKFIQ